MFTEILKRLVESIPGATGAILADWEGESVAFYTSGDDFQLKVIAAHKGIIMGHLRRIHDQLAPGELEEMVITSESLQIITGAITRDYSLVLTRHPTIPRAVVMRQFRKSIDELRKEIA
ncbi:MAG: roadblock/LC7 domain-containing protein [Desulfuromonadia bacterium]